MTRIADRNPSQHRTSKPIFEGAKNGLMQCQSKHADGTECDWVFFGPRDKFQLAWTAHWRAQHSQEIGIVLTHREGSRLDDLIAMQKRQPTIVLAR